MDDVMSGLVWVDYVVLSIIGLSMLMGLWRGFMTEVIALVTWVAAFIVAFTFMDQAALLLTDHVPLPSVRAILAFGGLFLATLIVGGLFNMIVNLLLNKSGMGGIDRMLGMFFGLGRGLALVVVLVMMAGFTPLPRDPWWQKSQLLPHFEAMATQAKGWLPQEYAQMFNFQQLPELLAPPATAPAPNNPASPAPVAPPAPAPAAQPATPVKPNAQPTR